MKKLKAYFLLVSGIKDRCEGFSNESNKVPVLYNEYCCEKPVAAINKKQEISKIFFIKVNKGAFISVKILNISFLNFII